VEELDKFCMSLAINEAWKFQGLTYPNPAVGAVVTQNEHIVSVECHKKSGDPHAEVLAIKSAYLKLHKDYSKKTILSTLQTSDEIHQFLYENHDSIFHECSIYSTLEPCNHHGKTPPCSTLISKLGFKRIIFGSFDYGDTAHGGALKLKADGIDVVDSIMQKECDILLVPFLAWQKSRFIFFKYAQTLNGVVAPGKISSENSFEMVHKLRDKIDLLIIGGETVRSDRPTLDARLVDGRAPDVMILSRKDDFDKTIPLFGVKNREVFIVDSLQIPSKYRFIMVEGGPNMLEFVRDICDFFLIFIAPRVASGVALSLNTIDFDYLNSFKIGNDMAIWAKRRGL